MKWTEWCWKPAQKPARGQNASEDDNQSPSQFRIVFTGKEWSPNEPR